jgi:hypothetical protein
MDDRTSGYLQPYLVYILVYVKDLIQHGYELSPTIVSYGTSIIDTTDGQYHKQSNTMNKR